MSGCIVSSVDIVIVDIDIAYFTVSTIFVLFIYPLAIPATKESPAPVTLTTDINSSSIATIITGSQQDPYPRVRI